MSDPNNIYTVQITHGASAYDTLGYTISNPHGFIITRKIDENDVNKCVSTLGTVDSAMFCLYIFCYLTVNCSNCVELSFKDFNFHLKKK